MKRSPSLTLSLITASLCCLVLAMRANAQTPSLVTDKYEYVPGERVHITGEGWLPGEIVQMLLYEDPATHDLDTLMAVADSSGWFTNSDYTPEPYDLGVAYTLVASGMTSGWTAQTTFADGAKVGSVSVGAQGPAQLCPGSAASYTITVNRGTGSGSSGNFTANLSVTTSLPAGVSASFSPNPVSFSSSQNSRTSTLTLSSSSSTPSGATSFTVKAATSAADFAESDGTLTVDTAAPVASAPSTASYDAGASCQVALPDLRSTVTASDNCTPAGSLVITQNPAAGTNLGLGTTTVTFTVRDLGGNTTTASTNVNVVDHMPPTLSVSSPSTMTIECHSSFTPPTVTASDNCAGVLNGAVVVTGSVDPNAVGTYTVTYSVNDGHGNSASTTRTVNVVDTTRPVLSLSGLATMTVECHSAFSDPGATATDLCAGDLTSGIVKSGSVDANNPGTYTLSYSVNDGHGNSASAIRTVNVVDTTPPAVSLNGAATMTVECHSPFSDPGVTTNDLCAGDLKSSVSQTGSVDANTVGSYTLSYTVSDGHGNTASTSRTINVVDTTPPVLSLSGPATMTVECHGPFSDPGATASDLCAGDLTSSISKTGSVDANAVGSYTLSYSVNDGHGNSANATRTVNVVDTTPPVLSMTGPATMTVECHGAFSDPGASASDLCAGDLTSSILKSGSVDANTVGSYTLSYSVNDGHGNSANTTRTVNVVDTTPPVLSLTGLASMTVECHSSFSDPGATASDLCAGDLTSSISKTGSVDANAVGSYTLSYNINDGHGNSANATRTVNVVDTTPPVLSLTGLASMTVECHSAFSDPGASASDLCAGDLTNSISKSGSVDANTVGSYTLSYSVNDGHGNSASATRMVNVVDTTPPTLSLTGLATMTVECHSPFSDPGAIASDLCAGDLTSAVGVSSSVDVNSVGSYTLSYSVNDGHGNSANATRTVNVVDTTPPTLSLTGLATMTVECHSPFSDPGAIASDLCAGDLTSAVGVSGSVDANSVGSYTLSYSVNDGHGNSANATRTVNVVDTTPPVLSLTGLATMTVECHSAFSDPGATASDLCAGDLTSAISKSGSVDANTVGSYTLSYSVNDGHGNSANATRTVNVVDTTPPVLSLTGLATMTVECHSPFADSGASASDICAGDLTSTISKSGTVDANTVGTYTLSYSVNDGHGNSANATRTVNVVDTTPPTLSLTGLATMTVECHAPFSDPGATASDLCAGDLTSGIGVSGSVDANTVGSYTLSYSVNDGHGNSANATRTVNVVDTTPPTLSLTGLATMTVECHGTFTDPGASASDICAGDLTSSISTTGSVDANTVGSYTLSYSVNDGHGNSANASRTVNVVDTAPPTLSLTGLASMTVECHSAFSDPGATASDLCAGDLTSAIGVSGSVDANTVGSYTLSYSVNDGHGNSANASRTVNVVDTTPPTLSLTGLATITVECHGTFSDPGATASDLCAGDLTSAIGVSGSVDANTVGSYTLSYSVNDGHGNSAIATRTVNVVDTTPPALSLTGLATMTVECHGTFTDPGASASDVCAGDLTSAISKSGSVDANTVGTYTLSYSVNDGHGNSANATRTVNVVDTTPPTLSLTGLATMTVECHAPFSDPGATASDLCAGDLTSGIGVSGSVDANTVGSYKLSYNVNDGHGNSASATRTVNVVDTTPPALSLTGLATMTVECHGTFTDPGASASDICAGDLTSVISKSGSVDANTVGSYTLSYSVNDGHGNSANATRTVNVVDTTPPTLSLTGLATMTVECHGTFTDPGASASDICAGDLTSSISKSGSVDANTVGSYTLSYSVNDGHGNSATATRTVNVIDTTRPTLIVPAAVTVRTGASATACGTVVSSTTLGSGSAVDLCAGDLAVTRSGVPSGFFFPVGTTQLTYTATDPNGNVSTGTQNVTVIDDTPPAITPVPNISQVVDAGVCTAVVRFTVNVNDNCPGTTYVTTPASGSTFNIGTTTVNVVATDAAGNKTTSSFTITVSNPAPTVTISAPASGGVFPVSAPVMFSGSFNDNAGDTHTAQWIIDGQTVSGVVNEAARTVSLTRSFTSPGVYLVSLRVTDQCGGTGSAGDVGGLTAMVVIYDPNGGFVTGGGWIQSPAGAYRADVTMTGKANFGFVSKYQKGANVPDGETEFQFKTGNLNFHSSGYEWLTVAGARAQFKGWGTINGVGDYGFLLSAVDGDMPGGGNVDKFRIKIWNRDNSVIVYDNQYGSADTSAATTALGGGSIVIHPTASPGKSTSVNPAFADEGASGASGFFFTALAPAAPNPFRNSTTLSFSLGERSRVSIRIYDAAGREVSRPMEDEIEPGRHAMTWTAVNTTGSPLGSGVYYLRMIAVPSSGASTIVKKQTIVLVR